MKHDMKTIREALDGHTGLVLVDGCVMVRSVILRSAIGELEALRDATSPVPGLADSGPYTLDDVEAIEQHRGKPYARLRETVLALDAAKADAARLREALESVQQMVDLSERPALEGEVRAALAATDSAEWLAKHDAEVRAPLEKRIADAEAAAADLNGDVTNFATKVETLTKQLVAAANDAARAELRARDAVEALGEIGSRGGEYCFCTEADPEQSHHDPECLDGQAVLAASPDSDARLREVMAKAVFRGIVCGESRGAAGIFDDASRENDAKYIVDEALRGGA